MYSQQAYFELKNTLSHQTIRCASSLTQEIYLTLEGLESCNLTNTSILQVLMWFIKNEINESELMVLYIEWYKALNINELNYFETHSSSNMVDLVLNYFFEQGILQNHFYHLIISFLDTLNFLYNRHLLSINYPIDELEQLYVPFDTDGIGSFNVTMALNLYMVLDISDSVGRVSCDSIEFKSNFFNFLKDIRPINGYISLRSFKNYIITHYESNVIQHIFDTTKTLLNFMKLPKEMDKFQDIFEISLQEADSLLEKESGVQKNLIKIFMIEHYFQIAADLTPNNMIEVYAENIFIQQLTIEISKYYGSEYLKFIKMKLNIRFIQFILRNITKMFNNQIQWYIEQSLEMFSQNKLCNDVVGNQINLESLTNIREISKIIEPPLNQSNYFSFKIGYNSKPEQIKQINITLENKYQKTYETSPVKSLILQSKKVSLDLINFKIQEPKAVVMNIDLRKHTQKKRAQSQDYLIITEDKQILSQVAKFPAKIQNYNQFKNRKIESFETVINRLNNLNK